MSYTFKGRPRTYYPDFVVVDGSGKAVLLEVKSPFDMFRELTLAKSLACTQYAFDRGMGYLIADKEGERSRTTPTFRMTSNWPIRSNA